MNINTFATDKVSVRTKKKVDLRWTFYLNPHEAWPLSLCPRYEQQPKLSSLQEDRLVFQNKKGNKSD